MFVLITSRSNSKLGHLESNTRLRGQIKENLVNTLEIIMHLTLNVCLDDFLVKFETGSFMIYMLWSSNFVNFFCLGQFLSNYWSYSNDAWLLHTS